MFLLGLVVLAGCKEDDRRTANPLAVKVVRARLTPYVQSFSLTGEIAARVQSDLSFRVAGQVTERRVDVGSRVARGDVLATLDPKMQDADVNGASAAVRAAEARLRQVASNFERQKALLEQGFTSRRDYDQADQNRRSAEAMLDSARAQLGSARDQLAQTVLIAPAEGTITARHIEAGQVVQASQPAFTFAQDGPRDAVVHVQESALAAGFGNPIEVTLVSDPSIRAAGEIREMSPVVNAGGAVRLKIGLAAAPPAMALGAAVRVAAHAAPRDRIVLPWSALYSDGGRPAVWTVDPANGTVALRHVSIEAYQNTTIVVRDGLSPLDRVVTAGTQQVRPAQTVSFVEVEP
jgi:RND family efflux transporter MFP subunit